MIHSKSWGLLLLLLWAGSMLNALIQDSAFMPPGAQFDEKQPDCPQSLA
jgi:hypothetical protein